MQYVLWIALKDHALDEIHEVQLQVNHISLEILVSFNACFYVLK